MTEPLNTTSGTDTADPLNRVDSGIDGLSPTTEKGEKAGKAEPANATSGTNLAESLARVDSGVENLSLSPIAEKVEKADKTEKTDNADKAESVEPLTRVDSGVEGLSTSPPAGKTDKRRKSSMLAGVASMKDLWESKTPIEIAKQTLKTGWKINTSALTVDDKDILKLHLVTPPVRAIDLKFNLGTHVTARNRTGVTIKDAMDAIHKLNKKRADDELDNPYLEGFEWLPSHREYPDTEEGQAEKEEEWKYLLVHLSSTPGVSNVGGKKKKKGGE